MLRQHAPGELPARIHGGPETAPGVTLLNLDLPAGEAPSHPAPLGILYLAAALRERNIPVEVKDYANCQTADPLDPQALNDFLAGCGQVLGVSAMSSVLPFLMAWAPTFKAAYPDRTLILGGYGPTADPQELLHAVPATDFIVCGWGELALAELVEQLRDGQRHPTIPGVWGRLRDGRLHCGEPGSTRLDIDALPPPALDLVGFGAADRSIPMLTSRGCAGRCAFCDIPGVNHRHVRIRNLSAVMDEIELQLERRRAWLPTGSPTARPVVGIVDDTFCMSRRRVLSFCEQLEQRGLDIAWRISARVDQIDSPLLDRMADTGCEAVYFGIEAGSDALLTRIAKGFDAEQARRTVALAAARLKVVTASFIWGLPTETPADFAETLLLMTLCREAGAQVQSHLWAPLPRSRLYGEWRHRLALSEHAVSNIAGDHAPHLIRRHADLIRRHPRLCAPFYHFPHAELEERRDTLQSLGFMRPPRLMPN